MKIGYESETIEFNKSTQELKEGIISLSAMLNKHADGTIYFGVNKDGSIIGQEIVDRTLRDISQMIANSIRPQINPSITLELLEEKNVIKVKAQGEEKPYSAFGRYYLRSEKEDCELSSSEIRKILEEKENTDVISIQSADNQYLSFSQLKTLWMTKGLAVSDDGFEQNLGFYNQNGQYNMMAELLADKNNVSIQIVTFRGKDRSEVVKCNEYGFKCLASSMNQVLCHLESIHSNKADSQNYTLTERKLFDFDAFKEAWLNACLHTKWSQFNPPAIYIYSDRIEIVSTGGLADGLSKEKLVQGVSRPVNAKLYKIFGQLGMVKQTGYGIPLIIGKYGMQAVEVTNHFVNITIPFDFEWIEHPPENKRPMNEAQEKIYRYLKEHPEATIKVLVAECHVSDGYARKILTFLKENGYVRHEGSNKTGFWAVLR